MSDTSNPFNGRGPIINPQLKQQLYQSTLPTFIAPSGTQTHNDYKISNKTEREQWWDTEGINKYGELVSDNSITKNGEFSDKKLERTFRDELFKKTFGNLPNYSDLAAMSDDEADSYLARWQGRVGKYKTAKFKAKGDKTEKEHSLPYLLAPDSYETSPEGYEAGIVNAQLINSFGEIFNNWTTQERKKFYEDWDVKNTGAGTFMKAIQEYPEILNRNNFTSSDEMKDYFLNSFDKVFEAGKGKYATQQLNVSRADTNTNLNGNTASIMNPSGMKAFDTVASLDTIDWMPKYQEIPESTAYNPTFVRNMGLTTKEDWDRFVEDTKRITAKNEEIGKRRKKFLEDYKKMSYEELKKWQDLNHIEFKLFEGTANRYADEMEKMYNMSPEELKEYRDENKRKLNYKHKYQVISKELGSPMFFRMTGDGRIAIKSNPLDDGSDQYAEEAIQIYNRQNYSIPKEENPFAYGVSLNDMKDIVAGYSGLYQEFKGSTWMPVNEIPYDKIYKRTKDLWESGNVLEAIYQMDKIIENDVIDPHQTFFGHDNKGHRGSAYSAASQFAAMGVESLVESATFLPSLAVGIGEAFFPTYLQSESDMGFLDRALDNTLHNDWIPIANNQTVSDWAAEINNNNVIYGYDLGSYLLKGSGTAGAQLGNLLMFWAGGLEANAAKKLLQKSATATKRVALQKFVNEGNLAKRQLQINKSIENLQLFKANYGEAAQQALEGERQIYEQGESKKQDLIKEYRPEDLTPFEAHFTEDEFNEAFDMQENASAWRDYFNKINNGEVAIPPQEGISVEDFIDKVRRDAEGLHILYERIPNYNDNIALNAKMKANIDLATQTALLFGFDKIFGGLDKWTLDYAMGRKSLNFTDLKNRIKGTKIGNLKLNNQTGKQLWSVLQNPIMETATEVLQQTGSAITKQVAEYNMNSFLENQLYGNGLQSWAATTYEGLWNLNGEEFSRDAAIKETILQTLLTTPLMPVLGGYRNRSTRGQNQSWVSRALENIHYYSPIKTTLGEQLYNIGQHNKQVQAAVDYINRWGADPVNQNNTRGLIGVQNYSEKMIADLINNDEVSYNNDVFSRTLSEAIMLANTQSTEFAQDRLQWLTNMAEIKSATPEQKAAAIKSMREEAAGNSVVRNLSDEELLNLMETSSSKVLDAYNKVNDIINSDERFTDGTYNWQQQSALIFNRMAREDLQIRISDKENRIQAAVQSLGEIDLGESKTSKENVEDNKVNNKKVLLSGRDILALSPMKRAAMLSSKNLNNYSSEQQKIIKETINALNQVDGNIINDIRNAGLEEYYLTQIEKDYKASLQTPGWESKRVKTKADNIKKAFNSEGNTKTFNEKLSKSTSVQDVYNTILNEREANATREDDAQIDIESTLNSIQDPTLKQKVEEARKIERTANSIKSIIASTNLTDDIKDSLFSQVDRIASESSNVSELTDISKYNIPLTPDGQDLSGALNNILQTAAQNASNTQTVNSEPVDNFSRSTDDVPEPTDLGERGVDTAMPVNEEPLKKYTIDEAKEKLKELNDTLAAAHSVADSYQHDVLLVGVSGLLTDLEKKVPEGYSIQRSSTNEYFGYKLVKVATKNSSPVSQVENKKDDVTDIDNRKKEIKQPIDRDGITKVAEIQFREGGRVYSYPIRDEDIQLGDGINNTIGSETGRVINIREVQDDAEAEFLIYQTDKNGKFKIDEQGNRIKRDRPQFINRHSEKQEVKTERSSEPEEIQTSIEEPTVSVRYSNRTEYQQSVVDNNVTPAVTELDGAALAKGLFEPNQHTGQPNIMRQLQEEGAFDYINKGALNEGDEIEFVVTQEQMPDGSNQVVIWEVTEPKDGEERNNTKWYGKQLLNVLDQTEIEGKRAELITRIRKAYEEAGRPESFLYPDERFIVDNISHSIVPFRQTNPTEASSEETIESTNLQKGLIKKNGVWGTAFFNKAKGKMVHVPIVFRQAKKDRSGSTKILLSDQRLKSKTIEVRKTAVGGTGEMNTVSMVLPTPKGFVSVNSVYILTKDIPNSSDKYEESVRTGSVGKALVEKIKAHLSDIKTVSAFSDYLGFRRGYSEYIYNDRTHGRIDLGYRGSTGNNVLVSAIPNNGKYILVDPTDARNILNDNNGQGFTLDEICKEYLIQLIDSPEADVTMRLNMEAIENNSNIITDLIDDGLLWAPDSLNARFTAANTQFNASLNDEIKEEPKKDVKQKSQQLKETPKPAPVVSNINPSATTTEVKKAKPKVDDTVELGSKVKRRKLKVSKDTQITPESPTTPSQTIIANTTVVSVPSSFETLSDKDKQHVLTKVTQEEWENLTKEERDNILNC